MKTTTILFTGPDHWIDGKPLTPGVIYLVPVDVADALIALGKATADTGLEIGPSDGDSSPAPKKRRSKAEPTAEGGAQ